MAQSVQRYAFTAEWFDTTCSVVWNYYLFCFEDNSVEVYDFKHNKKVLRRTLVEGIERGNIFVGGHVTILTRFLNVTGYADEYTKKMLSGRHERTLALVKPDAYKNIGEICQMMVDNDLKVARMRMVTMTNCQIQEFFKPLEGDPIMRFLLTLFMSGPTLAVELYGPNAVCKWLEVMGPEDSDIARDEAPTSIRALYGRSPVENAVHGSASQLEVEREANMFFSTSLPPPSSGNPASSAVYHACALCIIKPHAVYEGNWAQIIRDIIHSGLTISGLQMFNVSRGSAHQFFQVFRGVAEEFQDMVDHLTTGPCIAVAVVGFGDDTTDRLNEVCGPNEPEAAKILAPKSVRAKYGRTKKLNAVHCTKSALRAHMDVGYFFNTLNHV